MPIQRPEGRVRVMAEPVGESRTKQEFKQDVDVNFIVKKFQMGSVNTHVNRQKPVYADVSDAVSLHAAMNLFREATEQFEALHSGIRKAADNDPVQLLMMLDDEAGRIELEEAGLEFTVPQAPEETQPEAPEVPAPVTPVAPPEAAT